MSIMFGMILFIIGTLGAFVAATAAIAYLRTMSVYMGMRKLYRISFNVGMITIATLVSVLIAQMLMFGNNIGVTENVVAYEVISEQVSEPELDLEPAEELGSGTKDEVDPTEVVKTKDEEIEASKEPEDKKNDQAEVEENDATVEQEPAPQPSVPKSSLALNFSVWSNIYKGKEYAYVEIENGVPYVYAPNLKGSFWYDLNNISSGRESSNIVVMANAGVFNDDTSPKGAVVQNGNIILAGTGSKINNTLVIDDAGNVGYTNKAIVNGTVEYTDVLTGKKVSGHKIVSAVSAFSPIVINGKVATGYKDKVVNYSAYRPRSIFCVRSKGSYNLIANKGEGENGGGWNFDDMATVALRRGCQFAFNLDGGGSTSLAWRTSIYSGFSAYVATERYAPTFIVFTADNLAPSGK